jgi:hypothetical protein
MAEPEPPVLDRLKQEVAGLGDDLRTMAGLRLRLARLEWDAALAQVRRLAIVLAVAGAAAIVALALFAVAAAEVLDGRWELSRAGWLTVFGSGLGIAALAAGTLAWGSFRRNFAGMQETLEELREDGVWIKDWLGKSDG